MVVSPFLGCVVTNCLLLLTSNSLLPPLSRGGFASSLTMPACSASVKSLPLELGGGGLPLFTEMPRRGIFPETQLQLYKLLCLKTGAKGRCAP